APQLLRPPHRRPRAGPRFRPASPTESRAVPPDPRSSLRSRRPARRSPLRGAAPARPAPTPRVPSSPLARILEIDLCGLHGGRLHSLIGLTLTVNPATLTLRALRETRMPSNGLSPAPSGPV